MKNCSPTDYRVVRSKTRMRTALAKLLRRKPFEEITVVDIVKEAEINRGTFYKHYRMKEELLSDWTADIMQEFREAYCAPFAGGCSFTIEEISPSSVEIFEHIQCRRHFYELAFSCFPDFEETFTGVLAELLRNELAAEPADSDLFVMYQAYAFYGMIKHWVKGGFTLSSRQMASELYLFITTDNRRKRYTPQRKERTTYG